MTRSRAPLNESRTAGSNGGPRPGTVTDLSPECVQPGRLDSLSGGLLSEGDSGVRKQPDVQPEEDCAEGSPSESSPMDKYQPAGTTVDETLAMVREEHERRYQLFLQRVGLGENVERGPVGRTEHAAFSPGLTPLRPPLGAGCESSLPHPTPGVQLELTAGAGCHSLPGERNQPQAEPA